MNKTHSPEKTLEETLKKGITEEFGIQELPSTPKFIGSWKYSDHWFEEEPTVVEKTVLYFLLKVETNDLQPLSKIDDDSESELRTVQIDELISVMKEQGNLYGVGYLDESAVLESCLKYL